MAAYRNAVPKMSARFEGLKFHHVAQENNQAADILARIGAKRDAVPPNIFLERLFKLSVAWDGDTGNNSPDPAKIPDTKLWYNRRLRHRNNTFSSRNNGHYCPVDRTIPGLPN